MVGLILARRPHRSASHQRRLILAQTHPPFFILAQLCAYTYQPQRTPILSTHGRPMIDHYQSNPKRID